MPDETWHRPSQLRGVIMPIHIELVAIAAFVQRKDWGSPGPVVGGTQVAASGASAGREQHEREGSCLGGRVQPHLKLRASVRARFPPSSGTIPATNAKQKRFQLTSSA